MSDNVLRTIYNRAIEKRPPTRPLIMGINGAGGSGKTQLALALHAFLKKQDEEVKLLHIDDFHNPKAIRYKDGNDNPASYYHHSIDYLTFKNETLRPLHQTQNWPTSIRAKSLDLKTDMPLQERIEIEKNDIVLIEGIFLFKDNMQRYYDLKIFLDVDERTILERVLKRDLEILANTETIKKRYIHKYFAGDRLYYADIEPNEIADIVIDNNDYTAPQIIKPKLNV